MALASSTRRLFSSISGYGYKVCTVLGAQCRLFSSISGYGYKVCTVLGAQWGDEGKGKLVDILASKYDMIGRFNGGANAGHTLVVNNKKYAMHLIPCGILIPGKINVIGNGVVLHVPTMFNELTSGIDTTGRLKVSDRAHLLFGFHQLVDGNQEVSLGKDSIGTTKKGIGPCYSSKSTRNGVRVGELKNWDLFVTKYHKLLDTYKKHYNIEYDSKKELDELKVLSQKLIPMITDTAYLVNSELDHGKTLLAEGANAALLDIDHGTYPFVTSSATAAGGICTGLGISPNKVQNSIGVVKAYTTRVGSGPFPTELFDNLGEEMRKVGHEFGTTTGRPRRCGWLDIPVVQYSNMLNGYSSINVTKLDVLSGLDEIKIGVSYSLDGKVLPKGFMPSLLEDFGRVKVNYESFKGWKSDISKCRKFEDLPKNAQIYLNRMEELLGCPVSWVGVGPGRLDMATKGFTV